MKRTWCLSVGLMVVLAAHTAHGAFAFVPGDYYSANDSSRTIWQYAPSGAVIGSLDVPSAQADEIRGIAFGPDGLLYATAVRGSGFAVLAIDGAGTIRKTYAMSSVYLAGNGSSGKVAVDNQHIYVGGQNQVTRFNVGDPCSGMPFFQQNQMFDVEILPSGNVLAASYHRVQEISPTGTALREFSGSKLTDIRGVEFDPTSNDVFVAEYGDSSFHDRLLRLDGATGEIKTSAYFWYLDDMFMTDAGNLLVGSRTQAPGIFSKDLVRIGTLGTEPQIFVTQYVPEPATLVLLGLGGMALRRRVRKV